MKKIDDKIRCLPKADYPPTIHLPQWRNRSSHANFVVIRNGEVKSLVISQQVAEELIAAGFSYGT